MVRISRLSIILMLLLFSACALWRKEPTPEVKSALLNVANDYLRSIALAKLNHFESMVYWYAYIENKDGSITKDNVREDVVAIKDRWSPEDHPLTKLVPLDLSVRGDRATLILQREANPANPKIEIHFIWGGGGWLIENDNLFGPDGYITGLAKPFKEAAPQPIKTPDTVKGAPGFVKP